MLKQLNELVGSIREEEWFKRCKEERILHKDIASWAELRLLPEFLSLFVEEIEKIIDIDPEQSEQEILSKVTEHMVRFLGAHSASVRIYDPITEQMLAYGSYPLEDRARESYIPLEGTIAGTVISDRKIYTVPDISKEKKYMDKKRVIQKGVNSLMAVPLEIPQFFPYQRDTTGVIQIYYEEKGKTFTPLEIQCAEVMSRRLSFVIARKKLLSLHRVNEKKETIVKKIFSKLGTRGGIKLKDVFNSLIPELADILNFQSCALFSLASDYEHLVLEAGYPDDPSYHGIGKKFSIKEDPVFEILLNRRPYEGDNYYELVTNSYVLVIDPQKSSIISDKVKRFARERNINSILYIPLLMGDEITQILTFDALDQKKLYTEDEIEVLIFLGRELMKAYRLEQLDDILHDFKNPAIAIAGFARRLDKMMKEKGLVDADIRISRYLDILLEETSRLQEMALSIYHIGEKQVINLTEVLKKRFEINKEAIKEQLKELIFTKEGPFEDPLYVESYPLHLERILDNLLNNATNAIPTKGGILSIRTYREGPWACVEIANTGKISEEERLRFIEGEGKGRGIYITYRIVKLLNGKIDIDTTMNKTIVTVKLPLREPPTS